MKLKELIQPALISIIPAALILINTLDLIDVFSGKYDYPFGSEFFTPYSIYTSQNIYVGYTIIFTAVLILLICFSLLHKWKWYRFFLILAVLLFLYPILTASN